LTHLLAIARKPLTAGETILLVAAVFVAVNLAYGGILTKLDPPAKNDFTSYYVAAHVLARGEPGALYYPEPVGSLLAQASQQHPWIDVAHEAGLPDANYYLYPPLFALVVLPLAWVPYKAAFDLWLAMNVLFLAAALALFLRSRDRNRLPAAAGCVILAAAFFPVWHHLKIGQSSLLLLLLLTAALVLLRKGRDLAAGFCLSGAILLKLTPLVFIPLLLIHKKFRAIAGSALGIAALTILSVIGAGWQAQVTYFTRMVPLLGAGTAFYPNQSLNGFLTRLMGAGDYRLADLSANLWAPRILALVAAAALVALALGVMWRRAAGRGRSEIEDDFAALTILSLVASPISWEHHYVLLLLPGWILISRLASGRAISPRVTIAGGAALALAGSYVSVKVFEKFGPGPFAPVLGSAALVGALTLFGLFLSGRAAGVGSAAGVLPVAPGASPPAESRTRAIGALLALLAVFAGLQFLLKVAEYDTSFQYGDFTSYYVAGRAVLEGEAANLYAPDTPDMILAKAETPSPWKALADARGVRDANYYLYPPFFALLAAPMALLSYAHAHDLWYLLNLLALGGFVAWFLIRGKDALSAAEKAGAVILTAFFWPALFTFGAGQANYFILLLIFAGFVAAEKGRDVAAGLALAVATAIKLTPGLLLAYFLWKRRFALVGWAAAGMAALGLAGLAAAGMETNVVYVTKMVPLLSRGCAHWVNQSAAALLSRLFGAGMFSWEIAPASIAVRALGGAFSLACVAALARLCRPGRGGSLPLEFSLVLVTSLFISPISWVHHAVLSLPALFFLLRHLTATRRLTIGRGLLVAASYAAIGIYFKPPGIFERAWATPLASYHLYGQMILWGMLAWEIARLRRAGDAEEAAA